MRKMSRRSFVEIVAAASASAGIPLAAQAQKELPEPRAEHVSAPPPVTDRRMRRALRPFTNQAGYNSGEAKRFVCPGAADGTSFRVLRKQEILFRGQIRGNAGNFSSFDPTPGPDKYIIEVDGFEPSTDRKSTRLNSSH